MGKKTNGEEDPDGWSKPIGKKRRGKKNTENADDFASLLPSSTRAGKAYQRSDVTKEDDQKVDWVRLISALAPSLHKLSPTPPPKRPPPPPPTDASMRS